jgi:multidrug resistance efflux pump
MEEDELTEVRRRIRKAEANLERAQERGNEALELEIRRSLNFLFKKEEELRSATSTAKLMKYNFEDRTNCL